MRAASLTRLVIAAAVAGSTLALPAGAAAQWRDRDPRGWDNRAGGEAFQRGFRDGERLGQEDARRGRAFNVQSHREYREADAGYDRNDGSRDRYRDEFRRGFTDGYRNGYRDDRWERRDGRENRDWNRGASFRDPGHARGFSDGYRRGVEDRRDNRRPDPNRFKEVRQGTAPGYNDNFGSRDRYTFSYRDGFRDGYEDGFRGAYARR
jgi:flagellar biosynthesis/type III secretory pathway protein FliH